MKITFKDAVNAMAEGLAAKLLEEYEKDQLTEAAARTLHDLHDEWRELEYKLEAAAKIAQEALDKKLRLEEYEKDKADARITAESFGFVVLEKVAEPAYHCPRCDSWVSEEEVTYKFPHIDEDGPYVSRDDVDWYTGR